MKKIIIVLSVFCSLNIFAQQIKPIQSPKPSIKIKNLDQLSSVSFKLIEKVEKKEGELIIPYEKYELANGLTVLVHEDHSDPIVHVDVTYHVGSAREEVGRSGFAHFFEHMMFQGSDHIADEQHMKIVSEAGGNMNGTTNVDRTNYFETLPSNQLEIALWLESDRMGFLLDAVTQKKFEVQRATVKNERGQNYDNRPYGLVNEKILQALYPYKHPYSWPTIGYIEDLNRVDVNDLKKFFMRWYGPNNATLTVSGDVTSTQVMRLAAKYFGPVPRGPEVLNMPKALVQLDKDRYISYEDNIRFPRISLSFPTVCSHHEDEAALDILANILGGTNKSILYKKFVKSQVAINAYSSNTSQELAGRFDITVLPLPGKNLSEIETMIREAINEFDKKEISDADLLRYKATLESDIVNSLSSVSGKASMLAAYQTFTGNPNYLPIEMAAYSKVTKEDIKRVFKKYIKDKPAVILSVYPKGKADIVAKADNYTPPKVNLADASDKEYKDLVYKKPSDDFDRNLQPKAAISPVVKVPDFWTEKFSNGLKLIGSKSEEVPEVTLVLKVAIGHRLEDPAKAGIARLTATLMNESSQKYTSEQRSEELEKLGSSIEVQSSTDDIVINITSLTKNLDATLKIAEDVILHPAFTEEEFKQFKNEQLEGIANQATQARVIADNIFNKLIYNTEDIMSMPLTGTKETVEKITLEDVKEYYKANFSPIVAQLIIVGNLGKGEILPKLHFLVQWQSKNVKTPELKTIPTIDKTKIYLVNKDKAAQSELRIGYMSMPFDATDEYYKTNVMNFVLGGAFNSRINLNLREDKGYTYGAKTGFSGSKYPGPFTAYAGVKSNETDSSIIEFMKEIKNYADNGITPEELSFTKNSIGLSDALKFETPLQKAGFISRILYYNLDKDYVAQQNEVLKAMDKQSIDMLAKKNLPYSKMNIVVVGDKSLISDDLKALGYEIVELNDKGNPIK